MFAALVSAANEALTEPRTCTQLFIRVRQLHSPGSAFTPLRLRTSTIQATCSAPALLHINFASGSDTNTIGLDVCRKTHRAALS